MGNYVEYNDKMAFHPGYYVREWVDESGLTQEDFARAADTTPKNLSCLINGKQSLSMDMALKLSRMTGTSVEYWMNLQNAYDRLTAEFEQEEDRKKEREAYKALNYSYFRDQYGLPDLPRNTEAQIEQTRKFLRVSSLSVLADQDLTVSFRSSTDLSEQNIIRANAMVRIGVNKALDMNVPPFDKRKFKEAVKSALALADGRTDFYPALKERFLGCGVAFVELPSLPGTKMNGATKKLKEGILLLVTDRRKCLDSYWFTLFHEVGNIYHGDYGISMEDDTGRKESEADRFAADQLIPPAQYDSFLAQKHYDIDSIKAFADRIQRAPCIVLGRLQKDGIVERTNTYLNKHLKVTYQIN